MRINQLKSPADKATVSDAGAILKEIDILTRRMAQGRITKITKMSDGNYCIRIEKYSQAEKITLEKNGKVSFTVGNKKYEGKLKSTASFTEELIAVIHSVKEGI